MDPASWERAKNIISEALNRAPDDREPFVRAECGDDSALCAEVVARLKQYDPATTFLSAPSPRDDLEDLQPGTSIGGYVIVDRLGRGGMGQVFLGLDRELHRKVALKCLLSAGSAARKNERSLILNEARAAAAISHVNVATVHHVIEHGERAFIVMEYVPGESLAAALRRERLPIHRVIAIGRQLAAALAAAHAQGVVHRDLKPSNIHITPGGVVKVIDFGVARAARSLTIPSIGSGTSTTVRGGENLLARLSHGGTPPYMSPEQLLGRAVDERSDIYSLGVVLFEMATGHRPFAATDPLDLIEALAKGAPRADATDPRVPRRLADVIVKTLSYDSPSRFQSATEVEAALASAPDTVTPAPVGRVQIVALLARIAAGTVAVVFALGCLGFLSTMVFNKSLGRSGGFQSEPWSDILLWGQRSLSGPLTLVVLASLVVIFLWGIGLVVQVAGLWPVVDRFVAWVRAWDAVTVMRVEQVVSVAGAVAISLLLVAYANVTDAWSRVLDTAPRASLDVLSGGGPSLFRLWASMVVVTVGVCLVCVIRVRLRHPHPIGRSSLYVCLAVFAVAVVLNTLPHRLIRDNVHERVQFDGNRCYVTGSTSDQFLLFCPDLPPPRNRIVARNHPGLVRPGIRESIFTPAAP
jgi:predicted Ser/Thr protein kinase